VPRKAAEWGIFMRKRTTIRVMTFLSAAVIVMGVLAWSGMRKAKALELYARANTQHAFDELVTSVSELSTALEKSVYITDPALESALCTQIFGRAMTGQMAMGVLPYGSQELEQTASFLSKVGDYAFVLSRTVGPNGGYSQQELDDLRSLSDTASVMALNLQDMQARIMAGALTMEEVYTAAEASQTGQEAVPLAGTTFETIEAEFPEMPTLIYDGPFSESLLSAEPKYLADKASVSEDEALEAAAAFLNVERENVTLAGEVGGKIPCYCFVAYLSGGEYTVYVTEQGGQILSALCSRMTGAEQFSQDDCLQIARDFLRQQGFENMQESYHIDNDGVLLVNFAYVQDGVLCYPDLIKVGVAMDTGAIMSYDARGYISAHTTRELSEPVYDRQDAQQSLSSDLDIQGYNLAVIPSEGGEERLCHEFIGASQEGQRYIIYVNALTGTQEKILILLEDEKGTLTI
jgi:germination protein YpeB